MGGASRSSVCDQYFATTHFKFAVLRVELGVSFS
jgi:hypothetical protein